MTSPTRARLSAFKTGSGRYALRVPDDWETKERARERAIEERGALRAKVAEQRQQDANARKATERLRKAARALPNVYGEPPGTPVVQAAVRRAKALCRAVPPMQALEECVADCALVDVVEAVLAMKGAPP
jgi:DNA-binding IclR family transcriptional regulator